MPLRKWLKEHHRKRANAKLIIDEVEYKNEDDEEQQQQEENDEKIINPTKLIYFACNTPKDDLINLLENLQYRCSS